MHCHVLPGLDDGPKTMEESLEVLREAQAQGIDTMIVTPHHHPGRYVAEAPKVLETMDLVRERMASEGIGIELVPGQECYYYGGLLEALEAGRVLTMANSDCVLVEFEPYALYSVIRGAVRELRDHGYAPIIAHFERYRCLSGEAERLEELRYDGAMLQMNFDRLLDSDRLLRKNPWRRLLKKGYVDYLGSDTHGMRLRPLHVREAVEWMGRALPEEAGDLVLVRNIRRLIGGSGGRAKR